VDYNSTLTLPAYDTFRWPGHRCANYKVITGDDSKVKYASEPITITGDTIIKAQWTERTYSAYAEVAGDCEGKGTIGIDIETSRETKIDGRELNSTKTHEICAFPTDGCAFDHWDYEIIADQETVETGTSFDDIFTIDPGTYTDFDAVDFTTRFKEGAKHSIDAASADNGTIRVGDAEAYEGKTVTITLRARSSD